MKIKILGMGCVKCKLLFANTQQAVQELGIDASIEKVEDFAQIAQYGVMQTPALVINEQVVLSGHAAAPEAIKECITKLKN